MTAVSADDSGARRGTWLVFALGPYVMCASALDVEGIVQCPEAIAKLPLMPDYALGAFLFRGRSAAAISLRKKLKVRQGEDHATGPFIVARIGDAVVAFWVDEVKDVIDEKDAEWRPLPSMLEGGLFDRFAIRDRYLILQTSFAALREAKVEFESFAVRVAAHAGVGVGSAASELPNEGKCTVKPADTASETAKPSAGSAAASADVEDVPSPSSVPPKATGSGEASPQRDPPQSHSTSTERTAGLGHVTKHRRLKLDRRADSRAAPMPTPRAGRVVRPERPVHVERTSLATAPTAHLPPLPADTVTTKGEIRDDRTAVVRRAPIAIALGIAAFAAILYGVLTTFRDDARAPASSAPAFSLPDHAIAPTAVPSQEPATKPNRSLKADAVVLTIEHRSRNASGAPAAQYPADADATRGTRVQRYTVVRGDTLWQISKKHVGDPFQYAELAKLSHIRNPDLIHPGDIVRIEIREPK